MIQTVSGSILPTVRIDQFFDRRGQMARIGRKKFRYLRRAGGTIRKYARRSIRPRKAISEPYNPPSSHEGGLRNSIFYGLDKVAESSVIGPSSAFRQTDSGGNSRGASLLEFGGRTPGKNGRDFHYTPRPFMGPALDEVEPQLPKMFAES